MNLKKMLEMKGFETRTWKMAKNRNHKDIFIFENTRNKLVKKARKGQWPRIQDSLNQLFWVKGKIRKNGYPLWHYRKMHLHWHSWCMTSYLALENHLHEHQWSIAFTLIQIFMNIEKNKRGSFEWRIRT